MKYRCDYCGKEIENRDRHGKRNRHHYCCVECAYAAKSKLILIPCDWCGKLILKKVSDVNRSQHNFCDRNCYMDYINFENAGAKNQRVSGIVLYRKMAELKTGKNLTSDDEIHHIDGNHYNNAAENLLVVSKSEHMKIHAKQKRRDQHGRFIK